MKIYAQTLCAAAREKLHGTTEHHPHRARFLRAEINQTGKTFAQLSAQELIEINARVTQKIEAAHAAR